MKSVWKSEIMQVSGDIIVLASSCPRGSHDPLTKLGGSLGAPIGQLDARTIMSPDSYLIARGVVSNQPTPASRFQLRAQSPFFGSEKLPKTQHTQKRPDHGVLKAKYSRI